jgi:hypothetical protein
MSFGSGGTAGFAFYGAMRAFKNIVGVDAYYEWKRGIKGVSGTSAGAICSLWFVLDIKDDATSTMLSRVDLSRVVSFVNIDQCSRRFGFSDMSEIRSILHMILECGGLSANATMSDLYRFTRIHTIFVASNLTTRTCEYIDHTVHGDMRIDDAVCASCAIPLLYHPIQYGDTFLVDGCITSNLPDCFPRDMTMYITLTMVHTPLSNISVVEYISRILAVCTAQTSVALRESGTKIYEICLRNSSAFDPTAHVYDIERDGYISGIECFTGVNVLEVVGGFCKCYVCNVLDPVVTGDEESPPSVDEPRDGAAPHARA